MFTKRFIFRPYLSLFCMLLMGIFVFLGTWQVFRTIEKEALQLSYNKAQDAPIESIENMLIDSPGSKIEGEVFRRVEASGVFLSDYAFYVDNVVFDGTPGYLLHVPLLLSGGEVLLVNRGWVAAAKTRGILPVIHTDVGKVDLGGTLVAPRSKPVLLGDLPKPDLEQKGLWFYVDLAYLSQQIQRPVLPLILELNEQSPLSLQAMPTRFDAKVGMHIGYAIQWYVFVLFVLIGYLAMSLKAR